MCAFVHKVSQMRRPANVPRSSAMRALILGAGIAGSAAAIALRSLGIDVDVYERRPEPGAASGELGAGVVCWPNATFVLRSLGLLDAVAQQGNPVTQMQRLSVAGEGLGSLPTNRIDERLGFPSLAILRSTLHRLLCDRAEHAGARFQFGNSATGLEDHLDGSATVRLADGTTAQADLIVGADGRMRSASRAYVSGDATPRSCGFTNWLGTVQTSSPTFAPGVVLDVWGQGARFGVVPLSETQAYWAAGLAGSGHKTWRNAFEGWPAPISEVLSVVGDAHVREIEVFDHDPLPSWHRRNVLVIGDAAHAASPTSGQGVGQALEDVWHLHQILAGTRNASEACKQLFEARSAKTTAIVEVGRSLARSLFDTDPARCQDRDRRSRATDFTAAADGVAGLWGRGLPL